MSVLKAIETAKRRKEIRKCKTDLFYLASKVGYKWNPALQMGVSEEFHRDLCTRMDSLRNHPRTGTFAPRKSQKSTLFTICLVLQELMRDPDCCVLICHAVSEEAEAFVQEIGGILLHNEYIRSLDPIGTYPEGHALAGRSFNICPDKRVKKWLLSDRFTIKDRPGITPVTRRQPSVKAKGAGSEITGAHVDMIFLDDIIGLSTVEDSTGMGRIRRWWKATTLNVLNVGGRVRLVGTRWDENDIYDDFLKSKEWDIVVRHAMETDGSMDYKGTPTVYGPAYKKDKTLSLHLGMRLAKRRERLELIEMGASDYAAQRMNDPAPRGSIPWQKENEQYCGWRKTDFTPAATGQGIVAVMSDPAPRAGAGHGLGTKEHERGDGSKDWWSIAVVKYRVVGDKLCRILLDGAHSQDWGETEGLEVCRAFMAKYRTPYFFNENYGGGMGDWTDRMRALCNRHGTPLHLDKGLLPKYNNSYASGAKNKRFGSLADLNDRGEFYINESCPDEFLNGDGNHTGFLTQMRKLRPLVGGRNNLRWDDDADVVARCTDSALSKLAPVIDHTREWEHNLEEYDRNLAMKKGFRRNRHIYMP